MTNAIQTPAAGDAVDFPACSRPRESEVASWLGELRKAQAGQWFHGPLAAPDTVPNGADVSSRPLRRHAGAPADQRGTAKVLAGAQAFPGANAHLRLPDVLAAAGAGARRTPSSCPELGGAAVHDRAAVVPPVPRQEAVATTDVEAETLAGPARARFSTPGQDSGPRVHLEHRPEGMAVWIGVDGDAAAVAVRAAAILSELRRSVPGGGPLALLVCNGSTVYVHPAASHMPNRQYKEDPR